MQVIKVNPYLADIQEDLKGDISPKLLFQLFNVLDYVVSRQEDEVLESVNQIEVHTHQKGLSSILTKEEIEFLKDLKKDLNDEEPPYVFS